jgi:Ca2+-binding EF-hand superfamily protein
MSNFIPIVSFITGTLFTSLIYFKLSRHPNESFKSKGVVLKLLSSLAQEASSREGFIHRGVTCNHCNSSPIRGIRYKCSNCADYDICDACESLEIHHKSHIMIKIYIPIAPLSNPRGVLLENFYPSIENTKGSEVEHLSLNNLLNTTKFDALEIKALKEQFNTLASYSENGMIGINRTTYNVCLGFLGLGKNLIAERIFLFYDQDNDGIISFSEFVIGLGILSRGNLDEKTFYAFKGYDIDNDGFISKEEFCKVFKSYFALSMELVKDVVKSVEEQILEKFDDRSHKPVSASFNFTIPEANGNSNEVGKDNPIPNLTGLNSISEDTIENIVDKIFLSIGTSKISFEEFNRFVQHDPSLLSWFEALGTIF